ncbi:MAG TPA: Zn-dependent exopeptidase M28, partial [Firmicutes bacterium]|nr:Zn-dependent exopeptidase M28 [Bacillota bacterium]
MWSLHHSLPCERLHNAEGKAMRKSLVWLFLALAWAPAMAGQPASVIVAFPLDEPIPQIFQDLPALVVSPETVLVVVPQEVMPLSLGRARAVGFKRHLPTWLAYGTSDTRIEGGTIYFSMPSRWIFAGDSQIAQGLRAEGLSVAPLRWVKLDRIMAPHFGERLTRQILSQRDRRFIKDLQEQLSAEIDTTAMVEHLYHLTFDSLTQSYRSRYACRSETATEIAPYLTGLLQTYLGSDWSIETMHFEIPFCPEGTDLINVIASRPGRQTSAFYVVCAHYDATAHRDSAWDWQTDPAPGADDNASSVVALLECARLLADVNLDVGLRFIAFSGEEQGRRGSEYYVDHLSESDSIIGVINLDMLGYAEPAKLIEITYDWKSYWLASLLSASIDSGFDLAPVTKNRTGIYNSDHGSFWAYGIPGVMLNDRTEESGVPAYPYYHT